MKIKINSGPESLPGLSWLGPLAKIQVQNPFQDYRN